MMFVVSAIYPNTADTWFNADYYVNRHAPLARDLLQAHGLLGMRLMLPTTQPDGWPVCFHAIGELTFQSVDGFNQAFAAHGEALAADTPNYTNASAHMQVVELAFASGESR